MVINWIEVYLFTSFLKLLLLHSYHSTDFEVHRNWLAVTNSLPIQEWYYESTSQWTLDYPPLFAWFEYLLSLPASLVDPAMVQISAEPYLSHSTLVFQRVSVIISDMVLCYACYKTEKLVKSGTIFKLTHLSDVTLKAILTVSYLASGALLIVDHVHFQYNGFLSGVFLLSIVHVVQGDMCVGGIYFSLLLNLKHIYLYVAPAYFIYMLRFHLFRDNMLLGIDIRGLTKLGASVLGVFGLSFGPFYRHLPQVLSRLFPVKRGLCHAYWAPNFWALYSATDIALSKAGQFTGLLPKSGSPHPLMSGLVEEKGFAVLPDITPIHCATLTLVAMTPLLVKLFKSPSPERFIGSVTGAALASFFFGYHVHEKAILLILVPFGVWVYSGRSQARHFLLLSLTGTYSLFPLLFQGREFLARVIILLMTHSFLFASLSKCYPGLQLRWVERCYVKGLVVQFIVSEVLLPGFFPSLQFLPLILYSVYCTVGLGYSFINVYYNY